MNKALPMSLLDTEISDARQWQRVGDVYEVTKKPRELNTASVTEIPFVAMADIPQGGEYTPNYIMKVPGEIRSGTYFEHGDILVAKITPSFENGKQALAAELPMPFGFATTEIIPLRPRTGGHDRRLLFFYLLHPDVRHFVAERMEGATGRQRIPVDILLNLPFPRFDLEEQTTIADSLEIIQQLKAIESRSIEATTNLKRAALQTLFTRGLKDEPQKETEIGPMPESWERLPISVLGNIVTGNTPPTKDQANYTTGEIPFVAPGDIEHGFKIEKTEKFITDQGLNYSRPITAGTTCFVCIGSTIGKVGYVTSAICATNQQINSILPNDRFDPLFIFYLMIFWADHVRKQASPSTVSILSKGLFEQIEIVATTNLDEQQEIAAILAAIDKKIDLHQRKRAVLNELFKALLHKLMTGEIRVADLDLSGPFSNSTRKQGHL